MPVPNTLESRSAVGRFALSGAPAPKDQQQGDAILRGMVGRGHGLDAISTFLHLDREEVLERAVRLDLPTPHDRPIRRATGPKAWASGDYFRLIECWVAGWHAASIGEKFGRSAGAIWSKARWLGLPRRDRSKVFRAPTEATATPVAVAPTAVDRQLSVMTATGELLSIRKIIKRGHVFWTPELDAELANRYWANQHYEAIATEWGLSARSIASRAHRLQLPRRERSKLVPHYDPSVIDANIAEARYVRRECMALRGWFFWGQKNGLRTSKRGQKIQARSCAGYGHGIAHSIGGFSFGL